MASNRNIVFHGDLDSQEAMSDWDARFNMVLANKAAQQKENDPLVKPRPQKTRSDFNNTVSLTDGRKEPDHTPHLPTNSLSKQPPSKSVKDPFELARFKLSLERLSSQTAAKHPPTALTLTSPGPNSTGQQPLKQLATSEGRDDDSHRKSQTKSPYPDDHEIKGGSDPIIPTIPVSMRDNSFFASKWATSVGPSTLREPRETALKESLDEQNPRFTWEPSASVFSPSPAPATAPTAVTNSYAAPNRPGLSFDALRRGAEGSAYDGLTPADIHRRRQETLERQIKENELRNVRIAFEKSLQVKLIPKPISNVSLSPPITPVSARHLSQPSLSLQTRENELPQGIRETRAHISPSVPDQVLEDTIQTGSSSSERYSDALSNVKRDELSPKQEWSDALESPESASKDTTAKLDTHTTEPETRKNSVEISAGSAQSPDEGVGIRPWPQSDGWAPTKGIESMEPDPRTTAIPTCIRKDGMLTSFPPLTPTPSSQRTLPSRSPAELRKAPTAYSGAAARALQAIKLKSAASGKTGMEAAVELLKDLESSNSSPTHATPRKGEDLSAKFRRVKLNNLPVSFTLAKVVDLVFGGRLEEIHYVAGTASALVTFLNPDECAAYHKATANGLRIPEDPLRVIYVDFDPQILPVAESMKTCLEQGATRVVRVIMGAKDNPHLHDITARARGNKNDRRVEHISIKMLANGGKRIDFRMASIRAAFVLAGSLRRDADWEHCEVSYGEDPCALAKTAR